MGNEWISRTGRWLAILLLCMVNAVLLAAPVHAAAQTPQAAADTVTLTLDNPGTAFIYGQMPGPTFTAVVTFGTKPTANHSWGITVASDDGVSFSTANSETFSPDGMTMTFTQLKQFAPIKAGARTATALFFNPETNTTVTSSPAPFTVNKATTTLYCTINYDLQFEGAGQMLHIYMHQITNTVQPPWYVTTDWQNGTATVTFDGPTHITVANLVPDSGGGVTAMGPAQNGKYQFSCAFSGTSLWTSATYTDTRTYTFSAEHSLGSIKLFTNPTTLVARQTLDYYVVFQAAPGLPTPTGPFTIEIGPYSTDGIQLSPKGDCLVHLSPLPSVTGINQITINYRGDITYNAAFARFPVTNPAIPGSSSASSASSDSGGTQTQATATTSTTGTPGATATADGTPTVVGPGDMTPLATPPTGNSGIFWLIGGFILLVLAGLGTTGGVIFYRRRRANSPANAFAVRPPVPSNDDNDTLPFTRYGR